MVNCFSNKRFDCKNPFLNLDVFWSLERFVTLPSKEKLTNLVLLVIVQSRPAAFEERQSCRETWGILGTFNYYLEIANVQNKIWNNVLYFTPSCNIWLANEHTSVLFLFGEEIDTSADIKAQIKEEQKIHRDIVQINGFMEHYNNLTLKTLYTLKLFLKTGKYHIIYRYSNIDNITACTHCFIQHNTLFL